MLPLIPEHSHAGGHSDSSSSTQCPQRPRPTSLYSLSHTRTLPHPPRKRHGHSMVASLTSRRSKTMPRSKSVPFSYSRTPTPASSPSPSVSTQEEDSEVNIKGGRTTPTNEMLSSIPSPLRPLSLNIKSEAATAGVVTKVDAQQQTPVDCQQAHNTHLQLRFADERYVCLSYYYLFSI